MFSPMLTAHTAVTGVSLIHGGCTEICPPFHEKYGADFNGLHMSWFLVYNQEGTPRVQMRWVVER